MRACMCAHVRASERACVRDCASACVRACVRACVPAGLASLHSPTARKSILHSAITVH